MSGVTRGARRKRSEPPRARWIAIRVGFVAVLLAVGFVIIGCRAVKLQVVEGDRLTRHGNSQWRRSVELRPLRGPITDRNGQALATSADAPSIAANPAALSKLSRAQRSRLARALAMEPAQLERKAQRPSKFVWLKRRIPPDQAKAVQALALEGVEVFQEPKRFYMNKSLAAHLLGFVGDDGEGLEGIERAYDDALQGGGSRVPILRDARGRAVLGEAPAPEASRAGARVELTIEVGLQLAAEQALSRAVTQARAASGMLVAMDPRSGEVLALANVPSFNPNQPRAGAPMRNRAVLDTFEPGSTFKIFTLAGALDAGVLKSSDAIDCGQGTYRIGNHTIHDHKPLGWTGPSKIIAASSNIGAAKIGARLGRDRLQKTLLGFGFGERTGTEIAGEPRGIVPIPQAAVSLATMSFGQGVTASPLQITTAIAAVANGGTLMKPILVRRVVDSATGEVISKCEPSPIRRAASQSTAATLTRWMEGVVTDPDGTGKRAKLDGWRVAGKTGTGEKADPITRSYSTDKRFSSFVGFAPAEAPRIVIGVFIDEPKGEVYGGEIAAPVFREVAEHALKTRGVPFSPGLQPAVAGAPLAPPAQALSPAPGTAEEARPGPLAEEQPAVATKPGTVAIPSVAGLPARAAVRRLEESELLADVRGTGRVTAQNPTAGQIVARGTPVRLVLAPPRP